MLPPNQAAGAYNASRDAIEQGGLMGMDERHTPATARQARATDPQPATDVGAADAPATSAPAPADCTAPAASTPAPADCTAPAASTPAPAPAMSPAPDLLGDARFAQLLAAFAEHGILRSEFDQMEMPTGHAPDEVWAALTAIRRSQGIHYRDISYLGGRELVQWYTPTHSIERMSRELARRTGTGSPLEAALHERHGRRFILKPLIEETISALQCDSLPIDDEQVRAVVSGERTPATAVERLALNVHTLLSSLLDADGPGAITPELIAEMYEALVQGVDPVPSTSGVAWGLEWPEDPIPREQALREICAMASGELVDPAEHPIITSQRIICKFWKTAPYPSCNYILGSLVSRLHMKQQGYPVFIYIPSSSMTLAWKHDNYTCEGVVPYGLSGNVAGLEREWTPYWESCLRLILTELDKLERSVLALKAHDDSLLARIRDDQSFNHRQRDVLSQAILVPETAFRIQGHREAYGLAYSTARQDLLALVKRGLFEMHYESKAQVFMTRHDMKRVLAEHYGLG